MLTAFLLLRHQISGLKAFEISVLNLNEARADQTGNGPVPAWAKNSDKREEFFKSVHSVSVANEEFVALQRKWLEQGYTMFYVHMYIFNRIMLLKRSFYLIY